MRIEVLGSVRLRSDDGALVEVAERKVRVLLAALVAADGEAVSADALIERAWGERLPSNPRKVLRAKLSQLRATLDSALSGSRELLERTPVGYRLAVDPDAVDARQFLRDIENARRLAPSQDKAEALRQALALWQGEPYADFADEIWLAPAITELRDARAGALELFIETLVQHGLPEQAIEQASGALETYLTRERLVAALMLALYQVGRQHDALELFESLRERLSEELGADPSPQVRELHARILRQDPTLRTTPTTPDDLERAVPGRTNIPAETSALIGRHQEIADIGALLERSRLVTLTGIGGVGKTRLALHTARQQTPRFQRGTWFLDLTELSPTVDGQPVTSGRVAATAIAALDLPEQGIFSHLECVGEALSARPALLVLDNCEHVVSEAAMFAAELLRETPDVRVLATSREPLGLPEEQRYDIDTLATDEAVAFFAARASATDPSFQLDESTAATTAELCRRLDGLPLALELAASRIRGVALPDLMERLSERLNLLRRPGRGVPRRQQTLRGMIDWSWTLLDDAEKAVLRRLSTHSGGLSLDAVEMICADDEVVAPTDVVDVLIRLVDRSMVATTCTSTGVRYGLLESIASYSAEKLRESGERHAVAQRHLGYYRDLASSIDAGLRTRQQRRWFTRLESERIQLRNAFEEAVDTADGQSAVELVLATFGYQFCMPGFSIGPSLSGENTQLLEDFCTAIELPGPRDDNHAAAATLEVCLSIDTVPDKAEQRITQVLERFSRDSTVKARVQWFAGATLLATGARDAGERLVVEAMEVLRRNGEDWDLAVAASRRDWLTVTLWREPARGLPDGRDVRDVLREVDDGFGLTHALALEHRQAEAVGDHARSSAAIGRALELSRELRLWPEVALWVTGQAIEAVRHGDLAVARQRLEEARALAADGGFAVGLAYADFATAMIARLEGDTRRARELLDSWMYFGDVSKADILTGFEDGFLAVSENDMPRAETALHGLLTPQWDIVPSRIVARTLQLAAAIHAGRNQPRLAAELLGAAEAVRSTVDAPLSTPEWYDDDRLRNVLTTRLTAEQLDEALRRGAQSPRPTELV